MKKLFVLILFLTYFSRAYATLQVFPTRVVLTDKNKITTISIRNKGNVNQTYLLKAVFFRMLQDGRMQMVSKPTKEERPLIKHIRFSPRKVSLKPGEEQVVRILLRKVNKLPKGDYRAHLRIVPQEILDSSKAGGPQVSMRMVGRVAVSISVLYYKGDKAIKADLNKPTLRLVDQLKKTYNLTGELVATGNHFPIGTFYFYKTVDGEKKQIGELKGISSYIKTRKINYTISLDENINKGDKISIEFNGPKEIGEHLITKSNANIL